MNREHFSVVLKMNNEAKLLIFCELKTCPRIRRINADLNYFIKFY